MFREMRLSRQALSEEACIDVLRRGTAGVLATAGDDGYPYAVPLSYLYHEGKIFYHGAKDGHKIDAILRNEKVSFCVIDQDKVVPKEFTTYYRSVIVFGKAHIMEDEAEKRNAIEKLAARYSPHHEAGRLRAIDSLFQQVCLIEIDIEHMTGKEAFELVKMG